MKCYEGKSCKQMKRCKQFQNNLLFLRCPGENENRTGAFDNMNTERNEDHGKTAKNAAATGIY